MSSSLMSPARLLLLHLLLLWLWRWRAEAAASSSFFLPRSTPSMPPSQTLLLNLILLSNHANLPPRSTIFLPFNQSIAFAFPSPQSLDTVSYHLSSSRLFLKDLLLLPPAFPLPTLLPGRTIMVSRTDQRVLVDDLEIIAPDLYFDEHLVVHGIRRALDPNFYMLQSSGATRISPNPNY